MRFRTCAETNDMQSTRTASRVWGRHSPTRFPQGQNERKANFGTAVESCSKKLPLSSAALVCGYTGLLHQYSDCGGVFCPLFTTTTVKKVRFGKCSGNFFDFPVLLPTTPQKAKMTDFPARTFPAAWSFPTIRRFGNCVLLAV